MARPETQQINEHKVLIERQERQTLQLVLCDNWQICLHLWPDMEHYITVLWHVKPRTGQLFM